jgi:hypothetical protein
MSLELSYGKCLAKYEGKGTIFYDAKKIKCDFEVGQLLNGEIILLCISKKVSLFSFHSPKLENFEGVTSEGYKIKSKGRIYDINFLPERPSAAKGALALRLDELSVQIKSTKAKSVRFGVTNFRFRGTVVDKRVLSLPLELDDGVKKFNVSVVPVEDYEKVVIRVSTLKDIETTCEVKADYQANGGINQLKKTVDALCRVMSVARGTKIQWIYCNFYDEKGFCNRRLHFAYITKPYCPLPLIDYRLEGKFETKEFLEIAYKKYIELRKDFKLDEGVIDTLLDARAEHDYLEIRAAKLAIALEKLKALYVSRKTTKAKEFTIDESIFKKIVPDIQKEINNVLTAAGIDKDSRKAIASESKIISLNRKSFAYIVRKLCKDIGLKVKESHITLFIQCRNKLVHVGDFYCNTATRKEKDDCKPLASPKEEYYFMVNFIDRIFLKLFGYDGNYINWHSFMTGETAREKL